MMYKVGSSMLGLDDYIDILTAAGTTRAAAAAACKADRIRAPPGKVAAGLANTANRTQSPAHTTLQCATKGTKKRHCSNRV